VIAPMRSGELLDQRLKASKTVSDAGAKKNEARPASSIKKLVRRAAEVLKVIDWLRRNDGCNVGHELRERR
jgi:hypothetical protein